MVKRIRKMGKGFFVTANIVVCLCFLLACLQPIGNPDLFWWLSFMSLILPLSFLGVLLFLVFWLAVKMPYAIISLLTLAIGYKPINVLFSTGQISFSQKKAPGNLRVMTWNIRSFIGLKEGAGQKARNTDSIFSLIDSYSPDIICFQEFGQYSTPGVGTNYQKRLYNMGYRHSVLSRDYVRTKYNYTNGLAIFSKYRFSATRRIGLPASSESLLYADVVLPGNDTIRVYTTHLQSFKFSNEDYRDLERIKNTEDEMVAAGKNIFVKMKLAFRKHARQADMIGPQLDSSPYPEITGCDLNDVPASYAYWKLRGNRKDAFLEKGFGIGRSFISLAPTLRIDYLFADTGFEVRQFKIVNKRFSDHLPLIADLKR